MDADYLIVGQGLAGSLLSRRLLARGRSVLVVDEENPASASRVAAGLINPVTGRKLVKTWQAEMLLPVARDFYRSWEAELGTRFYEEKTVWRFFRTDREEEIWQGRKESGVLAAFVEPLPSELDIDLRRQRGGIAVRPAAHLRTRRLLEAFRAVLRQKGMLLERPLKWEELEVGEKGIRWAGTTARRIVFCEGHRASQNPFFSWIPFRHAKGEILTVRGPKLPPEVVLNRGKWLLPLGEGRYRAGATYEWKDLTGRPTAAGRGEILEGLRGLLPWEPEIERHEAGVRPIVQDTRPVLGLHPAHPAIAIFNGLGSKGALWAPHFAGQLVDHLEEGKPLDAAVDVRRNL